ncbi:MAG: ABC transporter ATP-binding protein [bacterium]
MTENKSSTPAEISSEVAQKRLKNIHNQIKELANDLFPEEEKLIVAETDLSLKGFFQKNWLIVTDRHLTVFSFKPDQEEGKEKIRYNSVLLDNIEEIKIEKFVGNAFLKITANGENQNMLRFSLSHIQRFEWAVSKIEEIMEKETDEDLSQIDLEDLTRERLEYEDKCPICGRTTRPGMKVCPKCVDKQKLFKRMFSYLKPYWKRSVLSLVFLLIVTALNLTPPYITRIMIDDVFPTVDREGNYQLFIYMVIALASAYILRSVFQGFRVYMIQWLGQKVTMDLRSQVYSHIQKLSINYYNTNRTGKIMNRVTTDTGRLQQFLVEGLQMMLNHVFTIIGIGVILFLMDWRLALIALSPVPIILVLTLYFAEHIHKIFHRIWRRVGSMKAILGDTIPGIKIVKAFTKENAEIRKFDTSLNEVFSEQMKATKARSLFRPAMSFSTAVGAVLIWAYGGYNVLAGTGRLSLGVLVAFVSYMWQFYNPVLALARLSGQYERAITSAERVFNVIDIEPESDDYTHSNIKAESVKGEIQFENVSFKYEGDDEQVLKDINLKVKPGQTIGLVGPTGAGKTTFVNLLPRFYDINQGSIKLDDEDLRDYDLQWLRRQIGIVPQHPFLFYGTIAENIAYGIEDASREEIIKAAKLANAHQFIMDFPMGYDTHVGERGIGLSGGERQRISIARAILKDAQIMILDEATSAVDTETESKIQMAIDRLIEGRTTFVIAHRLSTLKNADKLIVIEDGEIVEEGNHQELLDKENGVFKKLWEMQSNVS